MYFLILFSLSLYYHSLEVALDRLANRLEAMDIHHEQQFASAVDNIGDIEVRERECVCVWCVCVHMCLCVCVYVCVCMCVCVCM